MSSLLAKVLVATDPRRNPAAGLFWRAASDLGRSLGNMCSGLSSLFQSSPEVPYQSYSNVPAPSQLKYSTMPHRSVPDYAHCISADLAKLREKHSAQQKLVNEIRMQIDSHERIDLCQLDREIRDFQDEIDGCQSLESAILKQRDAYCAEGMLRNVFIHGFSQLSLSRQIRKLRKRRSTLVAKQDDLKALVSKRKTFDFSAKRHLLKTQEEELNALWKRCLSQEAKLDSFNWQMGAIVGRIADTTRRLNCQIDKYNTLSRYEAELNAASNAYERRMVHKKCEADFGSGSVGRLLSGVMSQIRELSALYNKQVRQAERQAARCC